MKLHLKTSSLFRQNPLLVKLAISCLLLGLACRFFLFGVSPPAEAPFVEKNLVSKQTAGPVQVPETPGDQIFPEKPGNQIFSVSHGAEIFPESPGIDFPESPGAQIVPENNGDQIRRKEKCDLFKGEWVPNPSGPAYTNESCHLIEAPQNCMRNGRPDTRYLYWRWKPRDCDLPPFDAGRFLNSMRHKTWALIGDSISRNHVQSLLCMLSKVEQPVEAYHDKEYKSRRWIFPSYNFTVSVIWSPFLVKAGIFEDENGVSSSEVQLHLDRLDKNWTDVYKSLDYMIISTGKWFLKTAIYYEDDEIIGCHNCKGENQTEFGFDYAYRRALRLVLNFISTSKHKGVIYFRTATPDHFENGEWYSGGTCTRTTPFKGGETELKDLNRILLNIETEEFEKAAEKALETGTNLKLLDFTHLLLLRPDGHPGPYRHFYPFAKDKNAKIVNDCLHWCLPGPLDSWNDLMMEMIMKG